MNRNRKVPPLSRRQVLQAGTVLGIAGLVGASRLVPPALAAGRTLTIADVGVGDPGGDWSRFEQPTGDQVNLVSIGNAPSAVVNQLIAGGGQTAFDVINIVGGMQKPLVDNDLILELDTEPAAELAEGHLHRAVSRAGTPGFQFIGYEDKIYGVPTVLQGDSFAYLPRRPASSTPTPRCSTPSSRASSRSRTTTPPPARRPRCSSSTPGRPDR